MVRFQIRLTEQDFRLLRKLADQEYREPRQQAGILIREALENRGLLDQEFTHQAQGSNGDSND